MSGSEIPVAPLNRTCAVAAAAANGVVASTVTELSPLSMHEAVENGGGHQCWDTVEEKMKVCAFGEFARELIGVAKSLGKFIWRYRTDHVCIHAVKFNPKGMFKEIGIMGN